MDTVKEIGSFLRHTRKQLGITQQELSMAAGTSLPFIIDLERGKETCEIGKCLTVLRTIGISITLTAPEEGTRH